VWWLGLLATLAIALMCLGLLRGAESSHLGTPWTDLYDGRRRTIEVVDAPRGRVVAYRRADFRRLCRKIQRDYRQPHPDGTAVWRTPREVAISIDKNHLPAWATSDSLWCLGLRRGKTIARFQAIVHEDDCGR
jgi:hypothetical protein